MNFGWMNWRWGFVGLVLFVGCAPQPSTWAEKFGWALLDMVNVAGGTFRMGDTFENEDPDATPVVEMTVDDFRIGRFEVTFEQYDKFTDALGYEVLLDDGNGRGSRAAVRMTWHAAKEFCSAYGFRLPTEAEWEYAARSGGTESLYSGTSDPDQLYRFGRLAIEEASHSFPVGLLEPNALGLYDLSGNVAEWVGAFMPFYAPNDSLDTWQSLNSIGMRIVRGGSFDSPTDQGRTYKRTAAVSDLGASDLGFRCAADGHN